VVSNLDGLVRLANDFGAAAARARNPGPFLVRAADVMKKDGIPMIFERGWPDSPRAWDTGFGLLRGPNDSIVKSLSVTPESPNKIVYATDHPGGRVHNLGAVISAKSAPYLSFPTPGGWARKKSITIPKRTYVYFPKEIVDKLNALRFDTVMGRAA
jgi:hypothetical protein